MIFKVKDERGQSAIDTLAIMLLLIPVLLGALSLAQGYSARHALENSTAVAARQIALNPGNWDTALANVQTAVDHSLLGSAGNTVTCTVLDEWGGAVDPTFLPFASSFSVTCSVSFQAQIPFVNTAPRTLSAIHYEVMERYP